MVSIAPTRFSLLAVEFKLSRRPYGWRRKEVEAPSDADTDLALAYFHYCTNVGVGAQLGVGLEGSSFWGTSVGLPATRLLAEKPV